MKSLFPKTTLTVGTALLLCSTYACRPESTYYDPTYDNSHLTTIPLDFDWKTSQEVSIYVTSPTTTKVGIYADAACKVLLAQQVLEAETETVIPLTTMSGISTVYLQYIDIEGNTVTKPLQLKQTRAASAICHMVLEKAAEVVSKEDAHYILPNNQEYATLFFEDNYPQAGDYDLNDYVLGYVIDHSANATSETAVITLQIRAVGGKKPFIPGVELKGVSMNGTESITWESAHGLSLENLAEHDGSACPTLLIHPAGDLRDGTGFFNTVNRVEESKLPEITITITRELEGKGDYRLNRDEAYNFFLYNTENQVEIHEKGQSTTAYASNQGAAFSDEENNVWVVRVPAYVPHAKETIYITKAFRKFNEWLHSSGAVNEWIDDYVEENVIRYDRKKAEAAPLYIKATENATATAAGGRLEIPVEANCDFDVYCEAGWIYDYQLEGGKLVLYLQNNYNGEAKSGNVTLVARGDASVKASISVNQSSKAYSGAMIKSNGDFAKNMTALLTTNGATVADLKHIVFAGHSDKYAETNGKGLPSHVKDIRKGTAYEHVYAEWNAATKTVTITTPAEIISSDNVCNYMFNTLSGLESIDFTGFDMSNATSMDYMFNKCSSLQEVNLKVLNTAKVSTMKKLFSNCTSLTQVEMTFPKTALYDEEAKSGFGSGCTERLFENCKSLEKVDMRSFDFADTKVLNATFIGCSSLQTVLFGESTKGIIMLNRTFQGAGKGELACRDADFSALQYIPQTIFEGSTGITAIDFSGWKTPNLETMNGLFKGCSQAKKINLTGWTAPKLTSMSQTFDGCAIIEEIDLGPAFDIPTTANINYVFYNTATTSQHTVVKCSKETHQTLQTSYTGNSQKFLKNYVEFFIYE